MAHITKHSMLPSVPSDEPTGEKNYIRRAGFVQTLGSESENDRIAESRGSQHELIGCFASSVLQFFHWNFEVRLPFVLTGKRKPKYFIYYKPSILLINTLVILQNIEQSTKWYWLKYLKLYLQHTNILNHKHHTIDVFPCDFGGNVGKVFEFFKFLEFLQEKKFPLLAPGTFP